MLGAQILNEHLLGGALIGGALAKKYRSDHVFTLNKRFNFIDSVERLSDAKRSFRIVSDIWLNTFQGHMFT